MTSNISYNINLKQQILNVLKLSIPAILTQISSIVMQYIDSAMVGRLGANASASIGLVSTSTWLIGGICTSIAIAFSVQVAHSIGAGDYKKARLVLHHGLLTSLILSLLLAVICSSISWHLPIMLGGDSSIHKDAFLYFLVFSITIPFMLINKLSSSVLQCSGNMVIPSILNTIMCLFDVVFNVIFIKYYDVLGAAIGTSLATIIISLIMFIFCIKRKNLNLSFKEKYNLDTTILKKAWKIGLPIACEQIAMCGAMIATTRIISPLGNNAIAANSFAITAESICYMPGYGVSSAATALVGQQLGAGNKQLAKRYSNISVLLGCGLMTVLAIIMFFICPYIFNILTPDDNVRILSKEILRIGLIAEPLYGVSIVASGALRGAEDTLVPSIMNLISIWIVRIGLSLLLVNKYNLHGVWIAMTSELCFRGLILLYRQQTSKFYYKKRNLELNIE